MAAAHTTHSQVAAQADNNPLHICAQLKKDVTPPSAARPGVKQHTLRYVKTNGAGLIVYSVLVSLIPMRSIERFYASLSESILTNAEHYRV